VSAVSVNYSLDLFLPGEECLLDIPIQIFVFDCLPFVILNNLDNLLLFIIFSAILIKFKWLLKLVLVFLKIDYNELSILEYLNS
jgi:hypothetical protein